jgi:hypothetical protein
MFLMRWIFAEAMLDIADEREGSQYSHEDWSWHDYGNLFRRFIGCRYVKFSFQQHFALSWSWMTSSRYYF